MTINAKSSEQAMECNSLSSFVSSHFNKQSPFLTNNTEQNSAAKKFNIPKLFPTPTLSSSLENKTQNCPFSSREFASKNKFNVPKLFANPTLSSSLPNTANDSGSNAQSSSSIGAENSPFVSSEIPRKKFDIPNLFSTSVLSSSLPNSSLENLSCSPQNLSDTDSSSHTSLSSLVSSHLGPKTKIEVPKLFASTSPRTSPFNSLADLTKNHLHKSENKFEIPKIFGPPPSLNSLGEMKNKVPNKFELPKIFNSPNYVQISNNNSLNTQTIDEKLSKCNINNSPVDKDGIIDTDWHIDLSSALRNSDIVPLKAMKPKHVETEIFLPKFIDCENENNETHDFLHCTMDLSKFVYFHSVLENSVSRFGKIISRTYRFRQPRMYYEEQNVIKHFQFVNPSPDDKVLAYINRK